MISNHLQVENLRLDLVKSHIRQIRKPSKNQTTKTIRMIETCGGIVTPVVLDEGYSVIVGEHLVTAARQMGLQEIPIIRADHLKETQVKILRIAYDRIAEEAEWDKTALAEEFRELELLAPEIDLNRSNVWSYPSVNSFAGGRMKELALHPTVKPAQMVMDALKDCSRRGDIVLDAFGGSGTTLVAAEKTGRKARLIEIDPAYCDVTIRRWQDLEGKEAVQAESGKTYNQIQSEGDDDARQ